MVTKPELPAAHKVDVKAPELDQVIEQVKIEFPTSGPKRPKDDPVVGNLSSGSPAASKASAPSNKIQTGGFGDPNGIQGPGNPNRTPTINSAGSPILPGGPGSSTGNGQPNSTREMVAGSSRNEAPKGGGGSSPVSILGRPNPLYSAEGRSLRVEGEVVLEVVFLASGQVQITRVLKGLGHGLDEAAIQAAKQIRFTPAVRDGQAYDTPARVKIDFRLAA